MVVYCFIAIFHGIAENGTINIGDTWTGTYTCTKQYSNGAIANDGESDVKRLTMRIKQVTGAAVLANIDFDWTTGVLNGTGQYLVQGSYNPNGVCQALSMTPTDPSWLTQHPSLVPARVLVGRISDDRQTYSGDYTLNNACTCTGIAPTGYNGTGVGSTCYLNTTTGSSFCYVSGACPDSTPDPIYTGFFTAPCGQYVNCTSFSLSRICSTYQPSCPIGWSGYNYRFARMHHFFNG